MSVQIDPLEPADAVGAGTPQVMRAFMEDVAARADAAGTTVERASPAFAPV